MRAEHEVFKAWSDFLVSAEVGFRSGSLKCVLVELGGTSTCMHLHLQPCYGGLFGLPIYHVGYNLFFVIGVGH